MFDRVEFGLADACEFVVAGTLSYYLSCKSQQGLCAAKRSPVSWCLL